MNDPTRELLRMIYMDAKSGCEAVTGLLPKITDPRLRTETAKQLEAYASYVHRAEALMTSKNIKGITFSLMSKLAVRGGILMETAGAPTQMDLARLLYESAQDSAVRIRQAVTDFGVGGCDVDVLALGQNMAGFEAEEANSLGTFFA